MNFDLTQEVKLDIQSQKTYLRLRAILYALALGIATAAALAVLFPTQYFTFSFINPGSTKNNIIRPRDKAGIFLDHGHAVANENFLFDAALLGSYSKATIEVDLSKKSASISSGEVEIKKSYQSFFYPEGDPVEYKENLDQNGFSDGALVSYGDSAYVLSGGKSYPIDNADTFIAHGYDWNDVVPIGPDQLADYKKDKLFTLLSPHPNGTIVVTDDDQWYEIRNGQKHPLIFKDPSVRPKKNPIVVSARSLQIADKCELKKKPLTADTYACEIPVADLQPLIGMDYEFSVAIDSDIKIDNLNVRFTKDLTPANLRNKISEMVFRVKNNYAR